jgi:predicted dehydrogenase
MIRVSIVGLGLIGNERLHAVELLGRRGRAIGVDLCYDPYLSDLAERLKGSGYEIAASLDDVISRRPDLVVVAVPHDVAPEIVKRLLSSGLKVLMEKPLGRSLEEARAIAGCCAGNDQLWIGHNFRFFAGIKAMFEDIHAGRFGRPIGLSILMGHGGSPRDKESWKLDKSRAGGGALIDPGIHLIDLCRIVGGTLSVKGGQSWQGFWGTGIEEECRLLLQGSEIPMLDLTVSVVRWRSTFRIEFFGEDGYGIVQGRGRSYGPQTYCRGRRWGWQSGRPQHETEEIVVTTGGEDVFADELDALLFAAGGTGKVSIPCTASESLENMVVLEAIRAQLGMS